MLRLGEALLCQCSRRTSACPIIRINQFHANNPVLPAAETGAFSFLRTESLQQCAQSILRALLQPQSVSLMLMTLEQLSKEGVHMHMPLYAVFTVSTCTKLCERCGHSVLRSLADPAEHSRADGSAAGSNNQLRGRWSGRH